MEPRSLHGDQSLFATLLAGDGADATEIQALLAHESLNTSDGYIDATANRTRQTARADRAYCVLETLTPGKRSVNRACSAPHRRGITRPPHSQRGSRHIRNIGGPSGSTPPEATL